MGIKNDITTLMKTDKRKALTPRTIFNRCCLKCDGVEEEMAGVGTLVFCQKHFMELFPKGEITKKQYSKWLQVYNKKVV